MRAGRRADAPHRVSGKALWRDTWREWDTWSPVLSSLSSLTLGYYPTFITLPSVQAACLECKQFGANTALWAGAVMQLELHFQPGLRVLLKLQFAIDENHPKFWTLTLGPVSRTLPWKASHHPSGSLSSRTQLTQMSLTEPLGGGSSSYFPLDHK